MPRFLRQFGLRTLLIFCTVAAGCFGMWRWHMTWVDGQHQLAGQIAEAKGDVRWATWGPQWVHQLFGSYYFSNIVAIDWHHKRLKEEQLELVRQIPTLEELYIPGNRIKDEQLAVLESVPRLRKLAIWSNPLSNAALEHVGKLKQLEVLDVHRTKMDEDGLIYLRDHPRLEILRHDFKMSDVGISHLASMPMVSVDYLITEGLDFHSFRHLRDQIHVKRLYVSRPEYAEWATCLTGHPTLESLEVTNAPMTDAELQAMIAANTLTNLELTNVPVGNLGIHNAPHASRLKSLRLSHTHVTTQGLLLTFGQYPKNIVVLRDWIRLINGSNGQNVDWTGRLKAEKLEDLKYCRNATSVYLQTNQLDGMNYAWLRRLEKLNFLKVDYYGGDELLEHVTSLKELQQLEVHGAKKITPAGFQIIVPLEKLTTLSLRGAEISDESLEVIGQMKQLETLDISGAKVTDEGIQHLTGLENLVVLNISTCNLLTDEALKSVSELDKLQYLHAQSTRFTDEGLQHLHSMPRLSNVSLLGSKHTSAGIRALRNALPIKGGNIY